MESLTINDLLNKSERPEPIRSFIGFDGFIDEIVHVIDNRSDVDTFTRIKTIEEYARRLMGGSGLSTNVEIVSKMRKIGGNGPNFAQALIMLGVDAVYAGSVGKDSFDPVFDEFKEATELIGLADPGFSQCFEFDDGKVIVSKLETLKEVTPELIVSKIGEERLLKILCESELIAMNNWTMLPHMSEIWEMILRDYVPEMKKCCGVSDKVIFIDIADPEKRSDDDIKRALEILGSYTEAGFKTVLGLNKKEGCEITEVLGEKIDDFAVYPLENICRYIREKVNLTCLVVHPVDSAAVITADQYTEVPGPYCDKPKLTTGAGDNFNAGFMFGYMNGLSLKESLRCGVGASGFYVRYARSANLKELAEFLGTF